MPGVLELLPREQIAFDRMISIIRREFERFGFVPLSTPAIELTETLLTKSGGDTERQVYFVQSTGALDQPREGPPELALRFDLTVPLARYVAEHEHELTFPFRRYQIQRVYRGERAQRGRFREFHQCDIDVIGRDSLPVLVDAEMPAVIHSVFRKLELGPFVISLNHRRLMRGFLAGFGLTDPARQADVLREIDKLDKRGPAAVTATLADDYGLAASAAEILSFIGKTSVDHADALRLLAEIPGEDPELVRGREELITVLEGLRAFGLPESDYRLDFSIARGLDYYTGSVFETRLVDHPEIGSVCSGGRYDNLAGQYTKSHLPGVGISIGATRLFWQLREAGLVDMTGSTVQALVALLEPDDLQRNLALAAELRAGGINTEVQLEPRKLAKQFQYADRAGIRFVVMAGADECSRSAVAVKDLDRGAQFEMPRDDLVRNLAVEIEQARAMPPAAVRASDRSQSR